MLIIDVSEEQLARDYPKVLKTLLLDKTTRKNIVWATHSYQTMGKGFYDFDNITATKITGQYKELIQPRSQKHVIEQKKRTKTKAEVFTPLWIVDKQVSAVETEFASLQIEEYIQKLWLEITCGEAPYMVTRYDSVTGESIPLTQRVGFLDRKLQRINREIHDEKEYMSLVKQAFQSSYGYEYQGDSLLLARENLLYSFIDYYVDQFNQQPSEQSILEIAKIISDNVFQMDGLNYITPYAQGEQENIQLSLFDDFIDETHEAVKTKIKNWKTKKWLDFECLTQGEEKMKFDVVIGNPPYQEDTDNNRDSPLYHLFMEEAYKLADKTILITPARFLFNAGQTPNKWNEKMLSDEHLKVIFYDQKSSNVFYGTDIKGGVAVTIRDKDKWYGAINTFTTFEELNKILKKVKNESFKSLSQMLYGNSSYKFTDQLYIDYPEFEDRVSEVFFDEKIDETNVQIFGRQFNQRVYKYIDRKYIHSHPNLDKYKVILPGANGSGAIGEVLSTPLIGHTQTFISFGALDTREEAECLFKYIKTKFARVMLGTLKITQNNKTKEVWKNVPLQDFTVNSDIDWSQSIADIDRQLYRKYGLSEDEMIFIETHVKEMV